MKKGIEIKQPDINESGAACLASISAHYNMKFSLSYIQLMHSTHKPANDIPGLVELARKLDFSAKGVKCTFEALFRVPKPVIAQVFLKGTLPSYVVIYGLQKKWVSIMDPACGKIIRQRPEEFKTLWKGMAVVLMPIDKLDNANKKISVTQRFISLLMPHKVVMAQAFLGAAVYSILGLSTSVFVQKLMDYVLVDGNLNLLHLMGTGMLLLLFLKVFIGSFKSLLAARTGQKIDAVLILGYYKHLLKLPQQFFDTMRVGEIISRVNDAFRIRTFINNVALSMVVNCLIVIFTLLCMAIYSWKLALLVMVSLPLFVGIYLAFNKLNKRNLRKVMENDADFESHFVESLHSISTIKRFGCEEHANFANEFRFIKLLQASWISARTSFLSYYAAEFISGGLTLAVLWFGSAKVVDQEITPGILMSFYALTAYLLAPVVALIYSNQSMQDAIIAADRLFQIMDMEGEEAEHPKISLLPEMVADIHFRNVSFSYNSHQQVFEKFSLTIPKGKITAIIGESGCGKTTLLSLLQNIYSIQSGSIEIGRYNIAHVSHSSLRKIVGTVPQQIDLFTGSIAENIALGDYEPDMKRVIDICKDLNISGFIEKLPKGYFSTLGEHGVSLSGGEKQRIAIARALYKDPEILILDEATSALDGHSEAAVKQVIQRQRNLGKTIIMITHRLSSIWDADMIYLLENGNVIESGNHIQLMALKEKYFSFCQQQNLICSN
jgi:ATP-binding cassette subfamily B protein